MNRTTPRPPPPTTRFIFDEPTSIGQGSSERDLDDPDINTIDLDRRLWSSDSADNQSALHQLHLECYDECVFNDLPQYLVRIKDMRLYSRGELWKIFRPTIDTLLESVDGLENARRAIGRVGEMQWRKDCKNEIKQCLKYAIFSHRWGEEEPEFCDMPSKINGQRSPLASSATTSSATTTRTDPGAGYNKLLRFCKKAKEYGCEYVWSDTCCINKESSSELEEAIRSMYRWYRDAFVCIVYLAQSHSVSDFGREPWFTRGWTLQELLAPERLRMYGKDWRPICPSEKEVYGDSQSFPFPNDKLSEFMLHAIGEVSQIDWMTIQNFHRRSPHLMVSTKMRWASKRKTTRIEDVAYSLLGLFDIMMPIAYGEGERAFQRLLDAIAQRSGDPSFFAWTGPCSRYSMALPASPAAYRQTAVVARPYCDHDYAIQKRGVQLRMLVLRVDVRVDHDVVQRVGSNGEQTRRSYYVLEPKNPELVGNMKILGRLVASHGSANRASMTRRGSSGGPDDDDGSSRSHESASTVELDPEKHSYAIGVVDFQIGKWSSSSLSSSQSSSASSSTICDVGSLLPNKQHFGILMRIARGQAASGVDVTCRRIDTKGVLPLVECTSEYRAPLRTALLEHTRFLLV